MLQPLIHGLLLALGLILPLGAQNVFVFNQGANQKKISKALPVIITTGLCDTFLIVIAILGRITGKIDKSGKYIVILNKVSSVIVIIVGLIILKNIVGILS